MKRLDPHHADTELAPETPPPAQKRQRRSRHEPLSHFLELSIDVLRAEVIPAVAKLGFRELAALGCCNSVLRELTVRSLSRSTYPIPVSDCTSPVGWLDEFLASSCMQGQNNTWRTLYERNFNASHSASRRQQRAAELAGSWKQLFQCKTLLCREVSYPRLGRRPKSRQLCLSDDEP